MLGAFFFAALAMPNKLRSKFSQAEHDRIVGPGEEGLGSGLDEIEDAWLEKDRGLH